MDICGYENASQGVLVNVGEENFSKVLDKVKCQWYSTVVLPIRGCMRRFFGEISFLHLLYGYEAPGVMIGFAWGRYSYRVHEKILRGRLRD